MSEIRVSFVVANRCPSIFIHPPQDLGGEQISYDVERNKVYWTAAESGEIDLCSERFISAAELVEILEEGGSSVQRMLDELQMYKEE